MGYNNEETQDMIFSARYKTDSKEYFEYLLEQDKREVPQRKEIAKKRFIIEMSILIVVFILVVSSPEYRQPLFFLILGVVGLGITLVFLSNYVLYRGNEKYIVKLRDQSRKKDKNIVIHNRLEIYKDEIYLEMGSMRYYVRPIDIDEWFETENLLVIKVRQLKTTMCKDIEKIFVPKSVLGDKIKEVEDTISRMIIIGDKVLSNMSNKKK